MPKQPLAIDSFEVKFALTATHVLGPDGSPTAAVADALGLAGPAEEYQVLFLDGPHLDFHTERWNVRFRDKGGKRELSFKRRLPVYHESVPGVLETALRQGFDAGEKADGYAAEIEWGPERQTLSLVREEKLAAGALPATPAEAAALAEGVMPGKLKKWLRDGWTAGVLAVGHLYGPVRAKRWKWSAAAGKMAFEVWQVRTEAGDGFEPLVEVSFKTEGATAPTAARESLRGLLAAQPGWLRPDDLLKTDLVLQRYRGGPASRTISA